MDSPAKLTRYLSPLNCWALSFGCILGWGAFMMPGSTLLPTAGPLGTVIALAIGAGLMAVIASCIRFMAVRFPDSGGPFTYTKKLFGYDHAFLCSWSVLMAYVAIAWANATAIVLISRFLLGPVFQFGFHYVVAGYDVYLGEVFITLAVLVLFGLISCLSKRLVSVMNTILALGLLFGTIVTFALVMSHVGNLSQMTTPPFASEGHPIRQVLAIVALAPWAYVGFESISLGVGEIKFSAKYLFAVLVAALVCGALVYILTTMASAVGTPKEYASWSDYLANLGNLDGLKALPLFNAVNDAAGEPGLALLGGTVLCALSTSLLGLYRATSRLMFMMAEDEVLPKWFSKTSHDGIPRNGILFIMAISVFVPFVGRAAIGWIVDVTSISASIAYAYISACCYRQAKNEGRIVMSRVAILGLVVSCLFFVFPLLPNIFSFTALAAESYFILAAWSIVGLVLFRLIFHRDTTNRFGTSTIVWIVMIFLIMFASTMWVRQSTTTTMNDVVDEIGDFYANEYAEHRINMDEASLNKEQAFLVTESKDVQSNLLSNSLIQMALIVLSLAIMFNIYSLIRHREREHDKKRAIAEESSQAKTVFLSNMSHDIRTPMNAIIGYTSIAQREDTTPEEMREYLKKIDTSSHHLLNLINDVLEMSRIESGKMELDLAPCNLNALMSEVHDLFATQMQEKFISYRVDSTRVIHPFVMCDTNRLNRVLLNLVSNAYKFTPTGGNVTVLLLETSNTNASASYEIRVKDTGIGMSPEFAERIFESFERERTSTVSGIQGTGLGMAITKSIVDVMDGTIDIITAPNAGSEFIVRLSFPLVSTEEANRLMIVEDDEALHDFTGRRILVVEDNEINLEISVLMLEDLGFDVDTATNGQEAVNKVASSQPGYYDIVLTDIQMPVMNGYDEVKAIRALDDPRLANIPVVACSANAFEEDVRASLDASMNGHLAKPLDLTTMSSMLARLLNASATESD